MAQHPKNRLRLRRYRRVNLDLRADSRLLFPEKESEWFFPNVKTLGGGGLTFVLSAPLSVGTELQMRLYYYTDEIELIGKVVWINKIRETRAPEFKCGLMFTEISDVNQERINHILNVHLGNPGLTV